MKGIHYVPLHFKLEDRLCLFVGGGGVHERRILALLPSGARILLLAPRVTPTLEALAREGKIRWLSRSLEPGDLEGASLMFVAVDSDPWSIVEVARARGIPVNVASAGREGDFIVPSVIRRGEVVVSVSTSGRNPHKTKRLARWLERMLERFLP